MASAAIGRDTRFTAAHRQSANRRALCRKGGSPWLKPDGPESERVAYHARLLPSARARCRHSTKHSGDADVLVDVGPMNAGSVTHYLEMLSLLRSCLEKAPGPRQRHAYASSVDQHRNDLVVSNLDSAYPGFSRCRNAHSSPPRFDPCAHAPIFLLRAVRPHGSHDYPPAPAGRARICRRGAPAAHARAEVHCSQNCKRTAGTGQTVLEWLARRSIASRFTRVARFASPRQSAAFRC
jgi:hypothetical protein